MTIATQSKQLCARKKMLRFFEAYSGCSFYFLASLMKNLLVKTVFARYYLKFSQSVFLKCFLIFAQFQPHVSCRHVSYKTKTCMSVSDKSKVPFQLCPFDKEYRIILYFERIKLWKKYHNGSISIFKETKPRDTV